MDAAEKQAWSAPTPLEAFERGLDWLERTQSEDGSWRGDYGGPLFLLPLFVGTARVVGHALSDDQVASMRRYLKAQQHRDGGFGLHVEGHSHMFTTVLCYVALRQLGEAADARCCVRALRWIQQHGGPQKAAPWGKFALAWMGLYDYRGLDPILPELWLLPESLPLHPSKLWCHCRMVYLPMAYLYGRQATAPIDALTRELREELYGGHYDSFDWDAARTDVALTDVYRPASALMRRANALMRRFERRLPKRTRAKALAYVLDHVRQEDENTNYLCIGPINKLYNTLCWHFEDPQSAALAKHKARLNDYLYEAEDGLKMQGYNSSQLWDTAFAAQAIGAHPAGWARKQLVTQTHAYIEAHQVLDDTPECARYFRHASKGGWPFSTRDHGWPISDCTAEGLKAALLLGDQVETPIEDGRLEDAAKLLLSWQNDDGGVPTYERKRGPDWLEQLNPSLVFDRIMVDYSYVECTSAAVQAWVAMRQARPERFPAECEAALGRAEAFIRREQLSNGAWEGSWGVCFSYGTWFGVWGLCALGADHRDPAVRRACDFLLAQQREDGAWGETVESCRQRRWVPSVEGQVVNTSWALLALMRAGLVEHRAVSRGIAWLAARQRPDGSYPDEHIAGVFNRTTAIHYDNYLKVFPTWAFGLHASLHTAGESRQDIERRRGR